MILEHVREFGSKAATMSSVQHAINVLRCISAANAPIGINQIARHVGLHKSSVSRLVATLERNRLVQRDPVTDRIALGTGLITLAAPLLAALEIRDVARPLLERLAEQTGETISFSVWDGAEAVSVEQASGARTDGPVVGPRLRNPGHCTASGKALLAFEPEHAIDRYCERELEPYTETTITDPKLLREELRKVRSRGYAVNLGEMEAELCAVASAVRDRNSRVIGVVTATVPTDRFEPPRRDQLIGLIVEAAGQISAKLGRSSPAA